MDDKTIRNLFEKVDSASFCELEKAKVACNELLNGYFEHMDTDPYLLASVRPRYGVLANIALDYILLAQKNLDEVVKAVRL